MHLFKRGRQMSTCEDQSHYIKQAISDEQAVQDLLMYLDKMRNDRLVQLTPGSPHLLPYLNLYHTDLLPVILLDCLSLLEHCLTVDCFS